MSLPIITPVTPEQCERLFSNKDKWQVSLLSGLIFMLVSSPMLYSLMDSIIEPLLGIDLSSKKGCPTMAGLLLHTIVFVLIVRLLMK